MDDLKLYMLLLGSKAPGRHVEQHDYFFGIATSLKELVPLIKKFWRGAAAIHIDGWREVNAVNGYRVEITEEPQLSTEKLFFINLGGYTVGKLEEQHYVVLTVQSDRNKAIRDAKQANFFRSNTIKGIIEANAHIDDKYGIDVDDIYRIEDMLAPEQKGRFHLKLTQAADLPEDEVHLGYFRLDKLV